MYYFSHAKLNILLWHWIILSFLSTILPAVTGVGIVEESDSMKQSLSAQRLEPASVYAVLNLLYMIVISIVALSNNFLLRFYKGKIYTK